MGSFNVGCGISNLSIHEGDRIGFQFIRPVKDHLAGSKMTRSGQGGRTFYIYCTDLNQSFFPPVYGTYGDYGNIENITPSVTVDVLEEIFRRPLADIINALGRQRSIYSSHGDLNELYITPDNRLGDYGASEDEKYLSVGFTKKAENIYEYEGYILHPDSNGKIVTPEGVILVDGIYANYPDDYISVFAEKTGLYPGIAKEDWAAVKLIRELSGMFFLEEVFHNMVEKLRPEWDRWSSSKKFEEDWIQDQALLRALSKPDDGDDKMSQIRSEFRAIDIRSNMLRSTGIRVEHYDYVDRFLDPKPFLELTDLYGVLTSVNRMLVPTYNGEQFGNDEASRQLNQITDSILAARKKEYDDDDYDEDDEEDGDE